MKHRLVSRLVCQMALRGLPPRPGLLSSHQLVHGARMWERYAHMKQRVAMWALLAGVRVGLFDADEVVVSLQRVIDAEETLLAALDAELARRA